MTNLTNFIKFEKKDFPKSFGEGRISTLTTDVDLVIKPTKNTKENAPSHHVYAKSPRGFEVQVGGIWKKTNQQGGTYYTISIKRMKFNANLGKFAGQDDELVQAIIEWEPQQEAA